MTSFYKNKIDFVRERLNRLDLILSRHNFYDCETILELQDPESGRKALLMQGDMDLNTDGSDGDRNFPIDGSSPTFQPQTSYRWPKLTNRPNPSCVHMKKRLATLKQEFTAKGLAIERNRELKRSIDETNRVINELKTSSFLISEADPSIVVPSFMLSTDDSAFSPSIGDYAAVIYDGQDLSRNRGRCRPLQQDGRSLGAHLQRDQSKDLRLEPGSQQHQGQLSHFSRNRRDTRPARPGSMAPKVQGASSTK